MNVLAIDGALGSFSATVTSQGAVAASCAYAGNVALERGLPAIAQTMASAGVEPEALDRIAVGTGPGSFTGLRIAVAYARALAQAWERPLAGVSSFDAIEYGLPFEELLAVISGRPGVISVRYRHRNGTQRASGRTGDVIERLLVNPPRHLKVVGAAQDVLAALSERGIVVESLQSPVAPGAAIALLGATGVPANLHAVLPDYGDLPPARPPARGAST